jgi:hypothetical protein
VTKPDRFTQNLFRWLNQVGADHSLTPASFRIAYEISQFLNRETLEAWPAQETLATRTSMTRRGVQFCLHALVARDHLSVTPGGGRGHSSRYRLVVTSLDRTVENANGGSPITTESANTGSSFSGVENANSGSPINGEKANHRSGKGEPPFRKGRTVVRTNHLKNTSEEPSEGDIHSTALVVQSDASSQFQNFWNAYPRRIAKIAAKKAFDRAIVDGADPTEIIAAAAAFTAYRLQAEPDPSKRDRFTPHPATWLNAGRWGDDLTIPLHQTSRRPTAVEIARLDEDLGDGT